MFPNKWLVYALIGAATLLAVKLVIDKYHSAIEGAAVAEHEVVRKQEVIDQQALAIDKLREMGALSDAVNKQAKKEAEDERKRAVKFWNALQEAGKADPGVGAWFDTPVPPAVRSLRRAPDAVPPAGGVQRPDSAPRPNPGTGLQRRNERSAAVGDRGAGRVALQSARVQP